MANPFLPVINSVLPEPHASLLAGILFGVKAAMPKVFYDQLITTGLLHVIALSGINITILTNLTAQGTLVFGRRWSSIITTGIIAGFVLFVGPSPSIVRAALMGAISLISVYFGRKNWGLLSLFLAAGIMLLINFQLLQDLSFQLSFLATLGLLLANRNYERQKPSGALYWFKENLRLTLYAQLFTVPLILYKFHRFSVIAPIANIATEWVIQPIMILGFITALVGWIWLPLGQIAGWIVWVPLQYFITVIGLLARIPGASVSF